MSAVRHRVAPLVLAALLAVLTAGWVGGSADGAGAAAPDLPPAELARLEKIFNPIVKPLGMRVTRGMLQNLDTYEEDPNGTHLAIYVEPTAAAYSDAQYLKSFTKLTHVLLPKVFNRWEGLESFDICQEPVADTREVPPPATQIFVARSALDRVGSWKTATLTEMLAASPRVRSVAAGYYVYFAPDLRDEPAFVEASAKAGWTTGSTALGH